MCLTGEVQSRSIQITMYLKSSIFVRHSIYFINCQHHRKSRKSEFKKDSESHKLTPNLASQLNTHSYIHLD
jgi:hypothetical protein